MARKPAELQKRLWSQASACADRLEKVIDGHLDALTVVEADGSVTIDQLDGDLLTPHVLAELRRRYGGDDGWLISHDDSNPGELELTPQKAAAAVSGRLDR